MPTLKICLLVSLPLLHACNYSKPMNSFTPVSASADKASVYIYRPTAMANIMYSPDLYINDEFRLSIKNGSNIHILLTPDKYLFEIISERNYQGKTKLPLNLEKGEIYYIRVDTSLKINSTTNAEPYQRSFNLMTVDAPLAVKEIADCCMNTKHKQAVATESQPAVNNVEQGFTVDKTQNPFSH